MNPEIKKFWEATGWGVEWRSSSETRWWAWKNIAPDSHARRLIAWLVYPGEVLYRWHGKFYSEAQMLRLIKLKAFL